MRCSYSFSAFLYCFSSITTSTNAFLDVQLPLSVGILQGQGQTCMQSVPNNIEPYVGPVGSITDTEGGIAIGDLSLQVSVAKSLVSQGRGLFLCIYDDEKEDSDGAVEEIIIPQGTPICGYARGYFSDKSDGDKSVGFLFGGNSANATAVFYNQQLMTLGDALLTIYQEQIAHEKEQPVTLFGHRVDVDPENSVVTVVDIKKEDEFSATSLGVYANDLAYDPDSNEQQYFENSERNNILQLVWRLAKDEKNGMVVPTWPVVVIKQDVRLLNTLPMEVGLQYGFKYWDAVTKEGVSNYIKSSET
eukprot:CAMPEP_0178934382 /NCGR_PEP_ID=MMETSP0786-20121207/23831_1 /TAXON_ID=186022 /ORGANISM="Thalassionema frauenfeldii, Strain CCMP 1798" /LENGTH=302 /DNA_ID=CAMNT_0020612157 /DNA_START=46 /DNA_END=954 /DNA_ORIENTATION=-